MAHMELGANTYGGLGAGLGFAGCCDHEEYQTWDIAKCLKKRKRLKVMEE